MVNVSDAVTKIIHFQIEYNSTAVCNSVSGKSMQTCESNDDSKYNASEK